MMDVVGVDEGAGDESFVRIFSLNLEGVVRVLKLGLEMPMMLSNWECSLHPVSVAIKILQ